jgi:hypothetical protein
MRNGVIKGVLRGATHKGGLFLENLEIIEDRKGRLSIGDGFEYFQSYAFVRGDNIIAIMIDRKVDSGNNEDPNKKS